MKRLFALTLSLGLVAAMAVPAMANGVPYTDPDKVYICHFEDDHEYGGVFFSVPGSQRYDGQAEPLDGDYVIFFESMRDNAAGATSFCEGYGGEVLLVSVSSLGTETPAEDGTTGHRVQLYDRVNGASPSTTGYPDGFKKWAPAEG